MPSMDNREKMAMSIAFIESVSAPGADDGQLLAGAGKHRSQSPVMFDRAPW